MGNFRQRLEESLPVRVYEAIEQDIQLAEKSQPGDPNLTKLFGYFEVLLSIPWYHQDEQFPNLVDARAQLESSHFGLLEAKEAIMEYLAVLRHVGRTYGQILCMVGPPGTGKTSLALTVGKVLNRPFHRIALGGLHDEAMLRGFHRTYQGSSHGKVIGALRATKRLDCVIVFDEIDKLASFKGDPAATMLEVLDPEQNKTFTDNYIEVPVDLSRTLFICTANNEDQIPGPLRDRMDIIRVEPYNATEKQQILIKHLLPKAEKFYKLQVGMDDNTAKSLVANYANRNEAGVRSLDRMVQKVFRQAILRLQTGVEAEPIMMSPVKLREYLGSAMLPEKRSRRKVEEEALS